MNCQRDAERREDLGTMSLVVLAIALVLLALCAAARGLAETPAAQMFVEMMR